MYQQELDRKYGNQAKDAEQITNPITVEDEETKRLEVLKKQRRLERKQTRKQLVDQPKNLLFADDNSLSSSSDSGADTEEECASKKVKCN